MTLERKLIYVPIYSGNEDLASFKEAIENAMSASSPQTGLLESKGQLIDTLWSCIERYIDSLNQPMESLRLYQDGLPVCDREFEIVRDTAESGSYNYRLLMRLINKGARLMGTESAELLGREYRYFKERMEKPNLAHSEHEKTFQDALLEERDRFIAARINQTLAFGETGVLFIGALHSIAPLLNDTIQVCYFPSMPAKKANEYNMLHVEN